MSATNIQTAIENVQKAAKADTTRSGQAHVELLDAVRALNLAAETPAESLMRMRFQPLQNAAIRMALEAGVLDGIAAEKGEKVTAEDLAKSTGYDALLIVRVMRLVTCTGVCEEVGENTYAANEMTRLIVTPGLSGGEKHHFDIFFPIAARLVGYMHETGVHQFPKSPLEKNPCQYTYGMDLWTYFEKHPDQRQYFDDYMATRRVGLATWYETFPMFTHLCPAAKRNDPNAVLLVDVGGNWGHEVAAFHAAHQDAPGRLVLQDLPSMIEKVVQENPPQGVECMAYDFFTPQPVKGARAYYFRNICHDWSDGHCERFLSNTAEAMEKGYSRLLIDDYVLPDTGAPVRGSSMDFLMMMYCSGIERSRRQWEVLLGKCGLEIVKIWGARRDYEQVIEARLRE